MDELQAHPAADLFPMMTAEEVDALGNDMLEHGQREPIALYDGKILDGRNRYRACLLKGIDPKFREERPADPCAFVATANLHRRHLSEEQRGMIAARLATMKQGARTDLSPNGETSQAKAAELLNVSKKRVERSHEVIEKGVPDLVNAVEHGDVKVSAAAEFANQNTPLDQQRLIVEHGTPADAVKATVKAKADRAEAKPQKPKPDMTQAADHAEETAAAKLAATAPQRLIDVVQQLGRIDVTAVVQRMTDDERAELMMQLVAANQWINKTAVDIAVSGGAKLGKLAPKGLRFEALKFLREAATRIEAELTDQVASEVRQLRSSL